MENQNQKQFTWINKRGLSTPAYINTEPVECLPNPGVVRDMNLLYSKLTKLAAASKCWKQENDVQMRRHTVEKAKNRFSALFNQGIHEHGNDFMQLALTENSSGI
jgi:hypothetical protein